MWPRLINTALGLWLMVSPALLGYAGLAADNDHIVGPIIATCACCAIWETTRGLRWVNLLLGLWLLAAPWVLGYDTTPLVNSLVTGVVVAALATVRGRIVHEFGGGWRVLWQSQRSKA